MTKCNIILLFVMGTKIRSVIRTAPTDLTLFSLLHVFTQVVPVMAWWVTRKTGKKNVGCKGGFRMSAFTRGRDAGHPRAWAQGCSQTSGEHTSLGTHLSSCKQLSFYFLTSSQFHKKEIFPWEHGGAKPYANNSLFYFLASFQFHKKEIFPWEHGNFGGGVGNLTQTTLFFIASLLSNFI